MRLLSAHRRFVTATKPARATLGQMDRDLQGQMLSRGEYLGSLYDMSFDKRETHASVRTERSITPSMRRNGTEGNIARLGSELPHKGLRERERSWHG